jgi:outer membrane protein assembly factor BamB
MGNTDKTDTVYCLDANTGAEIWKYSYPCIYIQDRNGPASTPTIDGKYVYTLSREGHLFCFNANSGEVIWSKNMQKDFGAKPPEWYFSCSPLVIDKMLIVDVGITLALNKSNGNLVWKTKDYGCAYSSPNTFKQGNMLKLVVFNASGLVILDTNNGNELSQFSWKSDYDQSIVEPIISGDNIFISSAYNGDRGCAMLDVSKEQPSVVWQNKNMKNYFHRCVLWKGYLYGYDESAELRCVDFQTGEVKWAQRGLGRTPLMLADGKLIIMTEKGDLIIAEASLDGYKQIAKAKVLDGLCWTMPILFNGKIYCRNHEDNLVCLDVSNN